MRFLKKIWVFIPFCFVFLMSQNTSALSPSYTQPNYIWRTYANIERWVLQEQGHVNLKNYIFSNIGNQFIGRYQFAFPANISNLADNTVLTIEFSLKHEEAPGAPGAGGTIRGWGNSREARINIGGSTSGYCSSRQDVWNTLTFTCEYVWDNSNVNLSTIWIDVGNFAVEANGIPWGNPNGDYLLYGHTFWIEYINYYYQTGLSASSQAIINAINNSNSVIINQNSQIIQGQNNIWQQNNDYYNSNYDAVDNINNQQANYPDASNQQTTNLLGVLLNFLGIITNFSATSCELNMPIPDFLGGAQLVNICQGRDLFGVFIGVISSMVALGFYLPLCISLLYMIYNEIRSFTNG